MQARRKGFWAVKRGGKAEKRKRGLTQRRKDAETQRNGRGKAEMEGRLWALGWEKGHGLKRTWRMRRANGHNPGWGWKLFWRGYPG